MKKIILVLIIIGSIIGAALGSNQEEPKKISYIQCVVLDGKIHDCTDITDFKILKTESMDGRKEHN